MPDKKIIIAIDGYSSSGKSTMAKALAAKIGYIYVDSGAMYRAVALYALRHGMACAGGPVDQEALAAAVDKISISFRKMPDGSQHTILDGEDVESEIRGMEVSATVSPVAEIPAVRRHLTTLQQGYGADRGIVMDGRDIGTTVFPDAEMKVFVDASPQIRAQRRLLEMQNNGIDANYDEVLKNVTDRDYIDTHRKESPLKQAEDAYVLCNDHISPQRQLEILQKLFQEKTAN